MDVHRPLACRHAALVQYDLVALDSAHVTQADYVLDPAENPKLGLADHRATEGGVAPIDYRDRRVGMREQRIGKRHRGGAAANHEIVSFELFIHHPTITPEPPQGVPNE